MEDIPASIRTRELSLLLRAITAYLAMSGGRMLEIIQDRPGDAEDERQERQRDGEPCHFGKRYDDADLRHVLLRR